MNKERRRGSKVGSKSGVGGVNRVKDLRGNDRTGETRIGED